MKPEMTPGSDPGGDIGGELARLAEEGIEEGEKKEGVGEKKPEAYEFRVGQSVLVDGEADRVFSLVAIIESTQTAQIKGSDGNVEVIELGRLSPAAISARGVGLLSDKDIEGDDRARQVL